MCENAGQRHLWYVYIMLCRDGSYYAGVSNDLQRRWAEHASGRGGHYTKFSSVICPLLSDFATSHCPAKNRFCPARLADAQAEVLKQAWAGRPGQQAG